jgi:hypothetical protein
MAEAQRVGSEVTVQLAFRIKTAARFAPATRLPRSAYRLLTVSATTLEIQSVFALTLCFCLVSAVGLEPTTL